MPIYEYECQSCGEQFEKLIRSLKRMPKIIACPTCEGTEVQRLMSAPAVHTGGVGSAVSEAAVESSASSGSRPVFGRKELKQAQEQKRQIRDQAKYEIKRDRKKS